MTVIEIKNEIKKTVDQIADDSLPDVLEVLKKIKQHPTIDPASIYQLQQIIAENRELLQKLAQ